MADYYEDVIFHNKIKSTCSNGPQITRQDLIDAIYKWDGETWAPEGFTLGSSYAEFNGVYPQGNQSANLFVVLLTDSNYDPILVTDQGFVVKKDLSAGGFLGTNQGEVWMGHGRNNSSDVPKIIMMHSGDGYDTLYLKKANASTPANLNLGKLEVQSTNNVFAVTAGDNGANQDTYLIPQNPSNGGLGLGTSAYPFKWVDATNVFCNTLNKLEGTDPIEAQTGITAKVLKTSEDQQQRLFLGRYSASFPWSYIAPSSNSLGFKWNNAAITAEIMTLTNNGLLTLTALTVGGTTTLNGNTIHGGGIASNFNPSAANTYGIGSGSHYWAGVVCQTIYRRYESSFDALDDLGLIKQYKTKTIIKDGIEQEVIDIESLPHLRADAKPDDPELVNFWDENKVSGFMMGCIKALVLRTEKLEEQLKSGN